MKNDKKIVLYAISQTPSSFIYASQKLKEDRDILKAVIPLEDFDNMKTDEIIYELITANPSLYNYYSIKYRKNYDLILKVIENYENYDYNFNLMIPFNKMSEKQLIVIYKKIVSKWKIYFKELPYKYRQNRSIVLEAIKAYGNNLQYASKTLKNDKELIEIARNQMKKYNKYEDFYLD